MLEKFKILVFKSLFLLLIQDCYGARTTAMFEILIHGSDLKIRTTNPFNYYPYAGIRVNSPNVSIKVDTEDCVPMQNGFCMFGVSNFMPVNIRLKGKPGPVCATLCLNGEGIALCQNYSLVILPKEPFIKIRPGACSSPHPVSFRKSPLPTRVRVIHHCAPGTK